MSWVPNKRKSLPPGRFRDGASEWELLQSDPGINSLANAVVDANDDDFDWVGSVPGRPGPYSTTWNLVYAARKPDGKGGFEVPCGESGDGAIKLNGQFQEVGAASTPHGKLRKPPVCHVIPWVLLSIALDEHAQLAKKTLKSDFKRFLCWGDVSNLRTGHNGCNAGGTKVTALTATSSQKAQASIFVSACATTYEGLYGSRFET
ncbi:hypothetical protein [Xanthomonas vesicatoria]|uniref:hypothetical protein n=1 Tax=Xanthomonas vesicatoria TaxID=56460 RepID=UPI000732190F|nr:hypothetical protein [Xanthomonas vesicatoria]KTF30704.1 hypothetical protein LMG920_18585 [Xanthomonas vesicatoria]MCC8557812.1 hypothetical protein [Xanthomonas vesicatoria]MCC8598154.1 hypothetical protein [Xanthomonas vesicatoria]MCC8601722.1 hypothetical protein [Xanthomonas vesicatoria]MCC8605619.1 hypothetical protein [Xanthomonas vesicatoria]